MTKQRVWAFCGVSLGLLALGVVFDDPVGPLLLTAAVLLAGAGVVLTLHDNLRNRR